MFKTCHKNLSYANVAVRRSLLRHQPQNPHGTPSRARSLIWRAQTSGRSRRRARQCLWCSTRHGVATVRRPSPHTRQPLTSWLIIPEHSLLLTAQLKEIKVRFELICIFDFASYNGTWFNMFIIWTMKNSSCPYAQLKAAICLFDNRY